MKQTAFLVVATLLLLFNGKNVQAQTAITQDPNKLIISNRDGKGMVDISSDADKGEMVIRVASIQITMGGNKGASGKTAIGQRKPSRIAFGKSDYQAFFELGINTLPCPDYSIYRNLPDGVDDFMDLRNAKSLQFAFSLGDVTLYLNRQRSLAFSTAFQLVFDEYVFSNSIRLVKQDGMIVPLTIPPSYKKSKLSTASFQIPLILTVGHSSSFHVSLGIYGGVRIGNHTKIKFPKEKAYDMYMAPFYGGITARAGFRGLYVYSNYALSDMFKRDKGPAVSPLTIGLGLGF